MTEFKDIYIAHARDVYRFALYLCGDEMLADEITAETFVRAWTGSDEIRQATVKAYLFTIARNLYLKEIRRTARNVELSDQVPDPTPDAFAIAHGKAELQAVMAILRSFPEVDRSAVLMRAQGISYEEIALVLGLSVTSAKVKVHRTRIKLYESIEMARRR